MLERLQGMLIISFFLLLFFSCADPTPEKQTETVVTIQQPVVAKPIRTGAEQMDKYLPLLMDKRVGIVANQTTAIGGISLVDSLLSLNVNITKIFCPEHGFRGDVPNGEIINNDKDSKTGLPIISLYTKTKKPKPSDLEDIDIIIFDLQDVGLRFFTNISTLHFIMEACAENKVEVIVFDRPNPHGFYIDGPVLEKSCSSFVGMHTVPVVHGMTIAEYALMINGEKWLKDSVQCKLQTVLCENYTHDSLYSLPVRPSPNLPNMQAIYLYPSMCFFEGTAFSLGRGTNFPFQIFGHPSMPDSCFSFTPMPTKGSKEPPLKGQKCFGYDLSKYDTGIIITEKKINLQWLISAYKSFGNKDKFFTSYFKLLAGSGKLKEQIKAGKSEEEIRESWKEDLENFKSIRKKYLLYKDFGN